MNFSYPGTSAADEKTLAENFFLEYLETSSDGLLLFVDDPNDFRPLLEEMNSNSDDSNPSVLLYLCNVGLKSWELPRNHTILIMQETR